MRDARTDRAEGLLAEAGLAASVSAAGRDGEIAAVRAAPESVGELRRLAPRIRALGFRAVALELGSSEVD